MNQETKTMKAQILENILIQRDTLVQLIHEARGEIPALVLTPKELEDLEGIKRILDYIEEGDMKPRIFKRQFQIFRTVKKWDCGITDYGPWYNDYAFTKAEEARLRVENENLGYRAPELFITMESSYVTLVPDSKLEVTQYEETN